MSRPRAAPRPSPRPPAARAHTPPHDLAAEAAVLGRMMYRPESVDALAAIVSHRDYWSPRNAEIHMAVCALHAEGSSTEPVAVRDRMGEPDHSGELLAALVAMYADAGTHEGALAAARIVVARSRLRHLAALGERLRSGAWEPGADPDALLGLLGEAAANGCAAREPGDEPGASWRELVLGPVLAELADGTIGRPIPTIGRRGDGVGLFYGGRVNGLFGASGDGKTWVALAMAAQELAEGRHVVWVDLEDEARATVGRLLDLGVDPGAIEGCFHYLRPDEAFGPAAGRHLVELIAAVAPTLVVVDSTGEAMALDGVHPNDDDEVATWIRRVPRPLADLGPGVVLIDHTAKDPPNKLFAIGSQRKRAAISGAAYLVEAIPTKEMGSGRVGRVRLTTAKDRHGTHVRMGHPAEFVLDSTDRPIVWGFEMADGATEDGDGGAFRPTVLMERASRWIELHPSATKNDVADALGGKRAWVLRAVSALVEEGFVATEAGSRGAQLHRSLEPFREGLSGPGDRDDDPYF